MPDRNRTWIKEKDSFSLSVNRGWVCRSFYLFKVASRETGAPAGLDMTVGLKRFLLSDIKSSYCNDTNRATETVEEEIETLDEQLERLASALTNSQDDSMDVAAMEDSDDNDGKNNDDVDSDVSYSEGFGIFDWHIGPQALDGKTSDADDLSDSTDDSVGDWLV